MEFEFDSGLDFQDDVETEGSISPTESQTSVVEVDLVAKLLERQLDLSAADNTSTTWTLMDFECDFSSVGYISEGSSADGAEVPIEIARPQTRLNGLDKQGMDGSSEVFQQFIPPTFSRLPPDGDEFPKSWSDERNSQNKTYRSELNMKDMLVFGSPSPPPPVPMSELPSEEDAAPPPLPASVPPLPPLRPNLARRSSVEDRKRLFEISQKQNVRTPLASIPRAQEPSKKSVKDKIAMFSTRSSSSEDCPDANLPQTGSLLQNSKLTSQPMRTTNGNATSTISKSSDNLLSGIEMSLISQDNDSSGVNGGNSSWKINKSTTDLRGTGPSLTRKYSNTEETKRPTYEDTQGSTAANKLSGRSQSMVDVAGEPCKSSYQMSYKYNSLARTTYSNNRSNSTAAATLMEQRRKCMTKLRGLVIPDKPESVPTSVSVVDLPTIISIDAVVASGGNFKSESIQRQLVSRTESIDGMSSSDDTSAKLYNNLRSNPPSTTQSDVSDWKFPNALPKYSPAFKRRSLTPYQPTFSPTKSKASESISTPIPEPKSLESLTSPRSDSSFEYHSSFPVSNEPKIVAVTTVSSLSAKRNSVDASKAAVEQPPKNQTSEPRIYKNTKGGKLEDSDNDSAVSSSRSSISHELSPPNSPTPGESSSTPDPDLSLQHGGDQGDEDNNGEEDSANNSDEGWRILKAQSVEAINRKNVLTSAKFSSGGGLGGRSDDGSTSSGNRRRSDDEEASYADAETEDTESSCSELEVSKTRRRPSATGRVSHHLHAQRRSSKTTNDTEEEEEEPEPQTPPSDSKESPMDFGDIKFGELTESPLQAIFDMEVKMAYINEICDALPVRGEVPSRYFNRRDSEATVIERPIERKLSAPSSDQVDSAERRARNRSSSGNESDFSSSISIASQSQSTGTQPVPSNDWPSLEKKLSKSLTAVNLLSKQPEPKLTTSPSIAAIPKAVTHTGGIVEMKIERIIEKTTGTDGVPKNKVTANMPNIPRGRNDFKSLSQKWQQISNTDTAKPLVPNLSKTFVPTPKPVVEKLPTSPQHAKLEPETYSRRSVGKGVAVAAAAAAEADHAWAERRRLENPRTDPPSSMSSTKRSVSVNDIRKAFEKAEQAVNSYGRDENNGSSMTNKPSNDSGTILSPPSAHFRVSSFDSTTSEDSSATTPAGIYGSVSSLLASAPRDPYGSITSLASSTSLISPQELQQLIDEANQSLEEAGTPSHEVSVVILHREFAGGSLGITLAGGADYETKEITVHKVLTGSIADRDGRVYRGDRVLSINGKNTKGLTHREALNLLKAPRTEVVLVVSRGRSASNGFQTIEETSATLDRAVEPLLNGSLASLLENDEDTSYRWGPMKSVILIKDGAGLGFSLDGGKGSITGDKPLTVKKIFVGGPADKSGELKVGDLITSINESNMSSKSRTEAWNFMKKLGDGGVKLSIRSPLSY